MFRWTAASEAKQEKKKIQPRSNGCMLTEQGKYGILVQLPQLLNLKSGNDS